MSSKLYMKPGIAFGDYIKTEKISRRKLVDHGDFFSKASPFRSLILPICLSIFGVALLVRLFFLQIVEGNYYRVISDSNRTRTSVIHAPRGIIFDRNKAPLVFNVPGFRKNIKDTTHLLSKEEAIQLLAQKEEGLEVDALRNYPYKDAFSHVIGYIGQITKEELSYDSFTHYKGGELLGKTGIERQYEHILKGIDGKKLIEVDSRGRVVRTLGQTDPIPGQDIALTLDAKLQVQAFEALQDVEKGTVIVSTPKGEILSLVSKPAFDPNLFTMGKTYKVSTEGAYTNVSEILLDTKNQPMLNRAISGVYPPGSTFKLITAAAGLEGTIVDEHFEVVDNGVLKLGEFSFANWYYTEYGKTEGAVNVVKAIKRSNDIYFYKLAEKVGVDKISEEAKKFGLGETLGIDLEGEAKGVVPDDAWKKKTIGEGWYLGDTYHYGIGQGYLLTTPLQVNAWTQVIANNGVLPKPHLLKSSKFPLRPQSEAGKVQNAKFLSENTISLIKQGMVESCMPGGVAWPLFEFKVHPSTSFKTKLKVDGRNILEVPEASVSGSFKDYRKVVIACKTGTAQHGGEKTLPHAWITLFAPAYDPQIVVTVLAESSGEGSNVAAPIAKKILEEWFGR